MSTITVDVVKALAQDRNKHWLILEHTIMTKYFAAATRLFTLAAVVFVSINFNASALAEGNGGDDFRQTAMEYEAQSQKMRDEGNDDDAEIYDRLAEIKYEAAELADEGRWDEIDWTEYHALNEQLWKK